jgi:DNA-binding beta-propeller fold protein YncE
VTRFPLDEHEVFMNKLLAGLCGVGMAAVVGVVGYILISHRDGTEARSFAGETSAGPSARAPEKRAAAEPARGADANVEPQIVAGDFFNPCGVAVQPGTGHVFVSMVERIVRVVPGDPSRVHDEITGFPTDTYGRGPVYAFGPLGLAVAGAGTLVVGDGGQPDGKEIVRIYSVGTSPLPRDKVRKAEDMTSFSTPIAPGEDSLQGEGNFYGVAINGSTAFVTSNGDDSKGWICKLKLDLKKGPPLVLSPFIKSKELTGTNAPMGATISPEGKLVVSQFGAANSHPDSLLTFYDPVTGKLEKKLPTGLRDIVGVAYSPTTGKLYALDFSWAERAKGGLFRLEVGTEQARAERIAFLDRPTALAFSPDGALYVTVLGNDKEKSKKAGQLLVFKGL